MSSQVFLDCTLRDSGYYNSLDFDHTLIQDYLIAMKAVGVDIVELGLRTTDQKGFKGACDNIYTLLFKKLSFEIIT